jgi:hypothetical protein
MAAHTAATGSGNGGYDRARTTLPTTPSGKEKEIESRPNGTVKSDDVDLAIAGSG